MPTRTDMHACWQAGTQWICTILIPYAINRTEWNLTKIKKTALIHAHDVTNQATHHIDQQLAQVHMHASACVRAYIRTYVCIHILYLLAAVNPA